MTVAVDAAERPEIAPPKAFVEILRGGDANMPFFKEPRLNVPRYSCGWVPVRARFVIPIDDPGALPGPGQRSPNRGAPDTNHRFGGYAFFCIGITIS